MSAIQRLMIRILPKRWAEDMERDSRRWMLRCRTCGLERSVWDAGGIRWKASGKPTTATYCPTCGQNRLHDLYKTPDDLA